METDLFMMAAHLLVALCVQLLQTLLEDITAHLCC